MKLLTVALALAGYIGVTITKRRVKWQRAKTEIVSVDSQALTRLPVKGWQVPAAGRTTISAAATAVITILRP